MNNVDRIFSERLDGHTSTPPAGAWEKVEMTISRRPATNSWLPMAIGRAAVLIPVVIAAGWMLTRTETVQPQVVTKTAVASPAQTPVAAATEAKTISKPVAIRRKPVEPADPISPTLIPVVETVAANPETATIEEITIEPVELITEVTEPVPAPMAAKEPMVIVVTLDAVAAAPEADKKALGRVAEFAMAVKHSDPIGSLRGVKDELFALDLRKKSTKKN